jgi:hypothetical protein
VVCETCHRDKGDHLFYVRRGNKTGLSKSCKACTRKRLEAEGDKARNAYLLKTYGISVRDYQILLQEHHGKCWICGGGSTKSLAVDHNHETGKVRGLLCHPCNELLGRIKDDPLVLEEAIYYLLWGEWNVKDLIGEEAQHDSTSTTG